VKRYDVPFLVPDIGDDEIEAVARVLRSGWLTTGREAECFEDEFREYTGATHALAVSSCTGGLHLALSALGIGPGDEVITTALTFCGTVQAIEETGARAVLADIGPDLNIDATRIEEVITLRTRAIVPVHIGGLPCQMEKIWDFARRCGLRVVEDAAHAAGARYSAGVRVGQGASDAIVFSFHATKNLTTGEGGMITTLDADLAARMRRMGSHGISREGAQFSWQYSVIERGFKYNLGDVAAAIGRVQLRKLDDGIARRAEIAALYRKRLGEVVEVIPSGENSAHHLFIVRVPGDRDRFVSRLAERGVEASAHFRPIPLHPYYENRFGPESRFERAVAIYPQLVSLPLFSRMTGAQAEQMVRAVRESL
jgi:dTDP-4-amino-4,6-dideoxygalactose transaminase